MHPSVRDRSGPADKSDRDLLEVMAAMSSPLTQSALLEWLKRAGRQLTATRAYRSEDVRAILERLVQRGSIRNAESEHVFVLVDANRHTILERAQREGRLHTLVDAIRRYEPRTEYGWRDTDASLIREFAWSLHLGVSDDLLATYAKWRPDDGLREELLVVAFGFAPPARALERFPRAIVNAYSRRAVRARSLRSRSTELRRLEASRATRSNARVRSRPSDCAGSSRRRPCGSHSCC